MGAPSLAEDAFERRDEDTHGPGGAVGPVGGKKVSPFVPPPKPGPLASRTKRVSISPKDEFGRAYARLRRVDSLLEEKLSSMAGERGWHGSIQRASEIRAQWAHLTDEESEPRPSYEDYLAVHQASDELARITGALSEPEAAVIVALNELKELRAKYRECEPDHAQRDVEQRAEWLLAVCELIEDADCSLGYLLFEIPAFDVHYDRYYDETEGLR